MFCLPLQLWKNSLLWSCTTVSLLCALSNRIRLVTVMTCHRKVTCVQSRANIEPHNEEIGHTQWRNNAYVEEHMFWELMGICFSCRRPTSGRLNSKISEHISASVTPLHVCLEEQRGPELGSCDASQAHRPQVSLIDKHEEMLQLIIAIKCNRIYITLFCLYFL